MLSPYFCQTRSCSSDYSKSSWKQTPHYTASLPKNNSSFLPLLSNEKGIPDKSPAEGRWRRLPALEHPSPPRHFQSPSPAQPQGLSRAFARTLPTLRSGRSPRHPSCSAGDFLPSRWIPALFTHLKGHSLSSLAKTLRGTGTSIFYHGFQ